MNLADHGLDKNDCFKPKRIVLECGCSPQDAIFEIDDGDIENNQCYVLDRVTIDTTFMCKPMIKIDFSCLVYFEAEDNQGDEHEIEVDLLFKLIRTCNGASDCIQSWRYLKEFEIENDIDEFEVAISEPFTVIFCDHGCPGCCEYKMIVEGRDFDGDFDALRVVKPALTALAQGLCSD
jgi:hypothetical protein